MTFANPGYLFLLILLIPIIGWYIYELRKSDASVQVSDTRVLAAQPKSWRIWLLHVPFVLRVAAVMACISAWAVTSAKVSVRLCPRPMIWF